MVKCVLGPLSGSQETNKRPGVHVISMTDLKVTVAKTRAERKRERKHPDRVYVRENGTAMGAPLFHNNNNVERRHYRFMVICQRCNEIIMMNIVGDAASIND